jgi:hypothetical protein
MFIIGFTGPPGSGKDTAYEIIRSAAAPEWKVERFSFADPLRDMADRLMGLEPGHPYWEQELKDKPSARFGGHTPRDLLIELGMLGRKYRPSVWLDLAVEAVEASSADVAVFTDVRFANEGSKIREMGGLLVSLYRPGHAYDSARESESGQAVRFANRSLVNPGDMPGYQLAVEDLWWKEISRHMGLKVEEVA